MKVKAFFLRMSLRIAVLLAMGSTLALLCSVPARAAALTLSIQSPVFANPGTSGNSFDVLLTNTSGSLVSIGAFAFEFSTASSDVIFTDATTGTLAAPYIFGGNSLFGPDIATAAGGQDLTASDVYAIPGAGTTLSAGAMVALGHILFDVLATAPSETVITSFVDFPATSLSDELGNDIAIDSLLGGEIVIGSAVPVPEPSSLALLLTAAVSLAWVRRRAGLNPARVGQ